jgi:hypothetical protein
VFGRVFSDQGSRDLRLGLHVLAFLGVIEIKDQKTDELSPLGIGVLAFFSRMLILRAPENSERRPRNSQREFLGHAQEI